MLFVGCYVILLAMGWLCGNGEDKQGRCLQFNNLQIIYNRDIINLINCQIKFHVLSGCTSRKFYRIMVSLFYTELGQCIEVLAD